MCRAIGIAVMMLLIGEGASRAQTTFDGPTAIGTQSPSATAPDTTAQKQQPSESWRYRRHDGLWWYWLPSNKWVYWTGNQWAPFETRGYSELRAARPARTYSYPSDQGNWGPVRYDRFGQPRYPYSQRKSGLRQLGPVPALGGVRSLPGWGGER